MKISLGELGTMPTEFMIDQVRQEDSSVVLTLKALEPVTWYAKVILDYGDLVKLVKLIPKRSLISFLFSYVRSRNKGIGCGKQGKVSLSQRNG